MMRVHRLYTLYRHTLPHGMQLHLCLCCVCFFQLVHEFKNKMQSKTNYMYVYIKGCTLWQSLSVCLFGSVSAFQSQPQWRRRFFGFLPLCSSLKSPCVYIGEEQLLFYMTLAFVYPFYFITLLVFLCRQALFFTIFEESERNMWQNFTKQTILSDFNCICSSPIHTHSHTNTNRQIHTHR